MPVYKDETRNSWYCKFYYTDWTGVRKAKLKRGFAKQKEAKEFERNFLDRLQANPQMTFSSLTELYMTDMANRLRQNTLYTKRHMIDTKVLPFFGNVKLDKITPAIIRQWQNEVINQGYEETYLKTINNQLSAILNYAVKYYNLKENPCHKAGSMGRKHAKEMSFWTRDEYLKFSKAIEDKSQSHVCFQILYWCGIRLGELLALSKEDIDFDNKTISISKSYQRIEKEDIITEPKTSKSTRIVAIPDFLCSELKEYLSSIYELNTETRIFQVSKNLLHREMKRGSDKADVKRIRIHDLRHSHASLLIELGFSPLLIAERLGHENIETTLNTYSHLYPHKQTELADKLEELK